MEGGEGLEPSNPQADCFRNSFLIRPDTTLSNGFTIYD